MKSLICSLLLLVCSFGLKAQTTTNAYPIKQGVANAPTTEAVTNAMYGKFIIYSYVDTTAANADPYIKHQAFAFISTTSPIALWYRDLTNTVWLQLSVSGSPTVNAWLTRGNDLSGQSLPNRLGTKNGDLLNIITSDQIRAIIPAGGIVRSSSAQNKYLMQDTIGKEIYYGDGGGTTPTWQQTLTAGSTLTGNNSVQNSGSYIFEMFNNQRAAIRFNNSTSITSLGDVDNTVYGDKLVIDASNSLSYFDNTDHDIRVGINTTSPSAFLTIAAGTAAASTAPLKFTSGTNLTSPEAGAMEWNGTNLFITQTSGPTRKTIAYTTDIPTTLPISSLTAATGTNSIDNGASKQTWQWNTLNGTGLELSSSSTVSTGIIPQKLLSSILTGANANSAVSSYGGFFSTQRTGSSSTNIGVWAQAFGATNNIAFLADRGSVDIGLNGTETGVLNLLGATSGKISIKSQAAAGTYNLNLPITAGTSGDFLTSAGGGSSPMTWTTPVSYLDSLIFNQASLSQFNIKFNKAKYGTASSKCSISIIGDSNTDTPEPFNKPLRALLLNYGKVDPGWIGFNPNQYPSYGVVRSVTVGWTKVDRLTPGLSLNLDDISSNDNTQYVQFETTTFNIPYDSLRIYFYKTAASGSFSVQVDSGTPDTVATAGANVAGKYTLSGMTNTTHIITIRPVGNGAVRMLGAYAYSSDASFVINKIAHSGADSYDFASFAPATWDYIYTDIGSDLAIINLGTNDEYYDTSVTNYQTNLGVLYDRIIADAPQSSVAFLAPGSNSTSPSSPQINYINAVINTAISKKAAFASLYKYWGLYPNNQNNGVLTDGIHYNLTFAGDGNAKLIGELVFTNQPNPIYTGGKVNLGSDATGDIWYRNSSGNFTRLAIGTTAQTLHVVGGLPAWRDTAAAAGIAIGNTITSATQGSVLFAGASGVLAQANSGLFYDASNVRLGLGLASPTYDFQLEKTVNGSVGLAIVNQSGGTSGAARIDVARSFGGDYFGSIYYAGDGNTIYTPLTFNILASASSTALNINHTGSGTINFLTSNTVRGTISSAGAWRMNTYGAGAATFDASGNITSVSDIRLKNLQGMYGVGLKQLMQIDPIVYKWKPESGMETEHNYIGFSAQNIQYALGNDAVGINKQGYMSIQDRAIMALLVNSVKEMQKEIEDLKQQLKNK